MQATARKREAVMHVEDNFQVSQRRACKSLAQLRRLEMVGVEIRGYGYFLLSGLPGEGETLKSSPIQSGAVLF